jgi:hypothetical protein
MRSIIKIALPLVVIGCGAPVLPIDTPETCAAACDNLQQLRCPGWREECPEMCVTFGREPGVSFHSECVANAGNCQAADACLKY